MDKMHAHTLRTAIHNIEKAPAVAEKKRLALYYMLYSAPILLEAIEKHDCRKEINNGNGSTTI